MRNIKVGDYVVSAVNDNIYRVLRRSGESIEIECIKSRQKYTCGTYAVRPYFLNKNDWIDIGVHHTLLLFHEMAYDENQKEVMILFLEEGGKPVEYTEREVVEYLKSFERWE